MRRRIMSGARRRALAAAFGAWLAGPAAAIAGEPVMVGGEATYDACGATVEVVGVASAAVYAEPSAEGAPTDRLPEGALVSDCDWREGWIGVVYTRDPDEDCGVGTPVATRQAYDGPCRSGWMKASELRGYAG